MVERRPTLGILAHVVLILGVIVVALPVYITFVASTHTAAEVVQSPMPMLPGSHVIENYTRPCSAPAARRDRTRRSAA